MIARIFWTLFAIETSVCVGAALYFLSPAGSRGWGPEGPVGGWLLFIPPIFLAGLLAFILIARSDGAKLAGIVLMALPLVQIAVGPLFTAMEHRQTLRSMAGDDDFAHPDQRNLAHAIKAHDVTLVSSLIPSAGDLNKQYNSETLLRFAVYNAEKEPNGVEVVQALLDAGANPNLPAGSTSYPLTGAIYNGPRLTEALLKAGADPNILDDARRPLWWTVLSNDKDDGVETLGVLLDHGADLTTRDSQGGPIAWAAYHAWMSHGSAWRLVWMLMDRGASWENEQEFGKSVASMFLDDYRSREAGSGQISDAMRQIKARLDAQSPAQ